MGPDAGFVQSNFARLSRASIQSPFVLSLSKDRAEFVEALHEPSHRPARGFASMRRPSLLPPAGALDN